MHNNSQKTNLDFNISHSFKIGFDLALQITGACDLSNLKFWIDDYGYSNISKFQKDVLLWKEISATGYQTNLSLCYYF